jgi:uncharacterized membrane protein YhiD involved in acid resistance
MARFGNQILDQFGVILSHSHGVDPTRIAAYVVSGAGFLGVIMRDGVNVRGVNTAARSGVRRR